MDTYQCTWHVLQCAHGHQALNTSRKAAAHLTICNDDKDVILPSRFANNANSMIDCRSKRGWPAQCYPWNQSIVSAQCGGGKQAINHCILHGMHHARMFRGAR